MSLWAKHVRHISRPFPSIVRTRLARRNFAQVPPTKDVDAWIRNTFTPSVASDSEGQGQHSLGGIFEDDEPLPAVEAPSPQAPAQQLLLSLEEPKGRKRTSPKVRVARTEFSGHTGYLTASVQKMNPMAHLIAGKPLDWAILQMRFNEKKRSKDIEDLLVQCKADAQRVRPSLVPSLVVGEIWVAKGPHTNRRPDYKGRGRTGMMITRTSRVFVVLKSGQTIAEKKAEKRRKQMKRIVSAAMVREDVPLRNMGGLYRW